MTFKEIIEQNNLFIISSHVNADGDNLSSSLGIKIALENMGKEAYYILDEELPEKFEFLYRDHPNHSSSKAISIIDNRPYVFIGLDCAVLSRFNIETSIFEGSSYKINIDHHLGNEYYADVNLVNTDISSTCEILYEALKQDFEDFIDARVATCLYTGILTDTGNFIYDRAGSETLRIAMELIQKGADKATIAERVFRSETFGYYKLMGEVLNTLTVEGDFAYACLTKEMRERWEVPYNNIETLVNCTINIDGVSMGILFKEKGEREVRVSLRSKGVVDVEKFASKFGGGGHKSASGCTLYLPLKEAVDIAVKKAKEYLS